MTEETGEGRMRLENLDESAQRRRRPQHRGGWRTDVTEGLWRRLWRVEKGEARERQRSSEEAVRGYRKMDEAREVREDWRPG